MYQIKTFAIRVRDWTVAQARGPFAYAWLAFLSFIEAIIFPIPPDVFLVGVIAAQKGRRWLRAVWVTTGFSLVGGFVGYLLGAYVFHYVEPFILGSVRAQESFMFLQGLFASHTFWAVFIAGFTPVPYKVFTLSAGFFGIHAGVFLLASLISRFLRFLVVGYITKVFEKEIRDIFITYLNIISLIIAVLIVVFIIFTTVF